MLRDQDLAVSSEMRVERRRGERNIYFKNIEAITTVFTHTFFVVGFFSPSHSTLQNLWVPKDLGGPGKGVAPWRVKELR